MDRSVHPPVFRAEAVHSCAASVAVVLGVGVDGQECPSSCFQSGGGTLLCRVGCCCPRGWCRWTGVSILLFSARRRYTLVPRRSPLSWGLVSMDRSVHPPVFRAEAVHSCAASVAVVLGVGIDGGVFILLFLERRRYTLVPRRLPLSWGLVSMEECLFSDCTNAFTFSRFEDLVAVPHV